MNDFNFFRLYEQKLSENKKVNYGLLIALIAVFVALAISFLEVTYLMDKADAENTLARALEDKTRLEAVFAQSNYDELSAQLAQLTHYSVVVSQMRDALDYKNSLSSKQMLDVASTIPQEVYVSYLSYNLSTISMNGSASNRVKIAELEYNIKNLSYVDSAFVSTIISADDGDRFTFIMSAKLKDVSVDEAKQ